MEEETRKFYKVRVGPDILGLQNRAKGQKKIRKKGYFRHKTGPQKRDLKVFFDEEEYFTSQKWKDDMGIIPFLKKSGVCLTKSQLKMLANNTQN